MTEVQFIAGDGEVIERREIDADTVTVPELIAKIPHGCEEVRLVVHEDLLEVVLWRSKHGSRGLL